MALEGSLHDMSLADLFQIFRLGPKTGVLLLASGPERGVIYVAEGRLIDAALVRGAERQLIGTGEDAILQLLQWEEATFTFRHDSAVLSRPARIVHDSEWLVLEGLRRRQNPLRALPYQQITMDTQLEMAAVPSGAESGVNLDLDQWRILSQIAISRDMREICEKTGMDAEKAIRTVTELVAVGLVEIVQVKVQPRTPVKRTAPATGPSLQPAMAGFGGVSSVPSTPVAAPGRSLLDAIMRRVRGL
jgi:hypothetical protein